MGFQVMQGSRGLHWLPLSSAAGSFDTAYIGQLVKWSGEGVVNAGQASGALDTTGEVCLAGVVVGTNNKSPAFNSTYKGEYITSKSPHDNTTEYTFMGGGGNFPVGDTAAHVYVDVIGPESVLKGPIFNAAYGTAITVGTVTTASTTGAGFTCSAGLFDFGGTVVTLKNTVYCRSGKNRGIYRVCNDVSKTVKTTQLYFPYDVDTGDTFVGVNLKLGDSVFQSDAEFTFIDAAGSTDTNYWGIIIQKLDLSTAGSEYAIFSFDPAHFSAVTG